MKNKDLVEFIRDTTKAWENKELTDFQAMIVINSVINPATFNRQEIEAIKETYKKILNGRVAK